MILVVVRHAPAMERDEFAHYCLKKSIEPDDEIRPLTKAGLAKMKKGATGLAYLVRQFEFVGSPIILTSPLRRAKQTAEVIRAEFKVKTLPIVTPTLSPNLDPIQFRNWLVDDMPALSSQRSGGHHLVIAVGHQPQLSVLSSWFLSGEARDRYPLKKGGALAIELGSALAPGQGRLLWSLPPGLLRKLAPTIVEVER